MSLDFIIWVLICVAGSFGLNTAGQVIWQSGDNQDIIR